MEAILAVIEDLIKGAIAFFVLIFVLYVVCESRGGRSNK